MRKHRTWEAAFNNPEIEWPPFVGEGTMTKHTPGPWRCYAWTTQDELEAGQSAYVLEAPQATDLIAEHHANARLIAAAPELLAALQALYTPLAKGWKVSDMEQRLQDAAAAIAKATS